MARKRPFFRPQIDAGIEEKLRRLKEEQHYHGSMASFVESILDKYADGLLLEAAMVERPMRAEFIGFEEKKQDHGKRRRKAS
jgi:hypothetical protein